MKRKLQGTVQAMFKFKKGAPNLELLCLSFLMLILTTELSCPKSTPMHISSPQGILIQETKVGFRKKYFLSGTGSNRLSPEAFPHKHGNAEYPDFSENMSYGRAQEQRAAC